MNVTLRRSSRLFSSTELSIAISVNLVKIVKNRDVSIRSFSSRDNNLRAKSSVSKLQYSKKCYNMKFICYIIYYMFIYYIMYRMLCAEIKIHVCEKKKKTSYRKQDRIRRLINYYSLCCLHRVYVRIGTLDVHTHCSDMWNTFVRSICDTRRSWFDSGRETVSLDKCGEVYSVRRMRCITRATVASLDEEYIPRRRREFRVFAQSSHVYCYLINILFTRQTYYLQV